MWDQPRQRIVFVLIQGLDDPRAYEPDHENPDHHCRREARVDPHNSDQGCAAGANEKQVRRDKVQMSCISGQVTQPKDGDAPPAAAVVAGGRLKRPSRASSDRLPVEKHTPDHSS